MLARTDDDGVSVADAMRDAGVDPDGVPTRRTGSRDWPGSSRSTSIRAPTSSGPACRSGSSARWRPRLRLEVELHGHADHAGTTPRGERRDALAAAARLIVAAEDSAGSLTVTTSRMLVEPNAPTTIPSHVRLWIDARALDTAEIDSWLRSLETTAAELEARSGVAISVGIASRSAGTPVRGVAARPRWRAPGELLGRTSPRSSASPATTPACWRRALPAAMVLVRNQTGVSHSPEETVDLDDAAIAAQIVAAALEEER